jgi:hypothetical protein
MTAIEDAVGEEAVITRANGDLHVTDSLGRKATLHWSRFHGLIVSADSAVYLGQAEVVDWLRERLTTPPSDDEREALAQAALDSERLRQIAEWLSMELGHEETAKRVGLIADRHDRLATGWRRS